MGTRKAYHEDFKAELRFLLRDRSIHNDKVRVSVSRRHTCHHAMPFLLGSIVRLFVAYTAGHDSDYGVLHI